MAQTIKGTLPVGVEVDGVLHREYELRGAIVIDNIQVTEEMDAAGERPDQLLIATSMMARQLVKLGTLTTFDSLSLAGVEKPDPQVNTKFVRRMHIADWNHLDAESAVLEKKLLGVEQTPAATGGSTSLPGASSEASTPDTSTT